ncbi:hypothetical protein K227x_23470 [Rubripirellula lacrimiformis]|uniref:Uncharacterized protein n=1 Tax=Rubripirellula lacrimiformis TaxID=1930273 RepID=A0A517N9Z9_9BACT|nr:hypothetical protein [Rubripirellula lacrimiformis]QDT03961.1 hypothetical protein K227x_23470 [Rubripirellula lacrimiformis]
MNARRPSIIRRISPLCLLVGCVSVPFFSGCASLEALDHQATAPIAVGPDGLVIPHPESSMTLPRFLGVDTIARSTCRKTVLLGQIACEKASAVLPALEPKPLTLPLSHPANAASASPAVAAAHKMKAAKAAEAAKVKALGALAGEDCTTNPLVEEAVLAGLDDVSAKVRIAAIDVVIISRRGCDVGCGGCCSDPIRRKLTRMVFQQTGPCCWFEPDSKARRLARLALDACGGPLDPDACGCATDASGDQFPIESPPPELIQQILLTP